MNEKRPDYEIAKEELGVFMVRHGLSIESSFVPFSVSRNAEPAKGQSKPWYSLNWRVRLVKNMRPILETDYSAGLAHSPTYKKIGEKGFKSLDGRAAVMRELETGFTWNHLSTAPVRGRKINPDEGDVFASLVRDSDVLEYPTFEEWAESFGYDADSRSAESTYRQCLEIALKLRAAIGDRELSEARKIANRL